MYAFMCNNLPSRWLGVGWEAGASAWHMGVLGVLGVCVRACVQASPLRVWLFPPRTPSGALPPLPYLRAVCLGPRLRLQRGVLLLQLRQRRQRAGQRALGLGQPHLTGGCRRREGRGRRGARARARACALLAQKGGRAHRAAGLAAACGHHPHPQARARKGTHAALTTLRSRPHHNSRPPHTHPHPPTSRSARMASASSALACAAAADAAWLSSSAAHVPSSAPMACRRASREAALEASCSWALASSACRGGATGAHATMVRVRACARVCVRTTHHHFERAQRVRPHPTPHRRAQPVCRVRGLRLSLLLSHVGSAAAGRQCRQGCCARRAWRRVWHGTGRCSDALQCMPHATRRVNGDLPAGVGRDGSAPLTPAGRPAPLFALQAPCIQAAACHMCTCQ